jgi:hypothetical protein
VSDRTKPLVLPPPPPAVHNGGAIAHSLARDAFGREIDEPPRPASDQTPAPPTDAAPTKPRETATDAIGRRAGALSDELDFPAFVSSLVHGTFDAIVDSTIRQMESFADLVSAVAKPVEQFTQENVSPNQARDFLVEQYPKDLALSHDENGVHVMPKPNKNADGEEEPRTPDWLSDYGLSGEELTPELIEEQLLPKARQRVATNRLQTLSTMVLLGMNRVIVKDGSIGARLRFRAAAADHTAVDYAASDGSDEAPGTEWGQRGSRTYDAPKTKVSTVGVNVQSDSELKAELFGDVKINFASETVPLDRFIDEARRNVLERHARPPARQAAPQATPAVPTSPALPIAPAAPTAPATPPSAPTVVPVPAPAAPAGGAR